MPLRGDPYSPKRIAARKIVFAKLAKWTHDHPEHQRQAALKPKKKGDNYTSSWTPERRKVVGERTKLLWADPVYRKSWSEGRSKAQLRRWSKSENIQAQSEKFKELWKNPEYRAKQSEIVRELWKTKEYREAFVVPWLKAMRLRPNKQEQSLNELLQKNFPHEWRYVGDGKVVINGMIPDFINVNGRKQIIELFGEYWHPKEDEEKRKENLKRYGYDTMVVWSEELKKPEVLVERIKEMKER